MIVCNIFLSHRFGAVVHLVAIGNTRRYDLFGPDFYRNISRVVAAADAITFADTLVEEELYVSI